MLCLTFIPFRIFSTLSRKPSQALSLADLTTRTSSSEDESDSMTHRFAALVSPDFLLPVEEAEESEFDEEASLSLSELSEESEES